MTLDESGVYFETRLKIRKAFSAHTHTQYTTSSLQRCRPLGSLKTPTQASHSRTQIRKKEKPIRKPSLWVLQRVWPVRGDQSAAPSGREQSSKIAACIKDYSQGSGFSQASATTRGGEIQRPFLLERTC